jgi:hypothetical protein
LLVVLFEDDEHGEEFFSTRDRGYSFAEAWEEERVEQFEEVLLLKLQTKR